MNEKQIEILTEIISDISFEIHNLNRDFDLRKIENLLEHMVNHHIKEGAKVIHKKQDYGIGTVIKVNARDYFPVEVKFENEEFNAPYNFSELAVIHNPKGAE